MDWTRLSRSLRVSRAASGIALCASLAFVALPARAAGGHLYLQVWNTIERFPLHSGIPATKPDLTIPNAGEWIAVAGDGTVYAVPYLKKKRSYDSYAIDAFAPGQTKPYRRVLLPHNASCTLSSPPMQGLAADRSGNLFVLVVYSQSGAPSPAFVPRLGGTFPICIGVAVFGRNASGRAKPLQAIPLNDFYFGGMSVDNRDNLYVALADYQQTFEYSDAVKNPQQTRTLPDTGTNVGVATDRRRNVFLFDLVPGSSTVNVFAPSWSSGPATRTLHIPWPYSRPNAFAVRGGFAYVGRIAISRGTVAVFDATGSGSKNPIYVTTVPGLGVPLAVGP
jgi:hypothetical protein